MRIITFFQLLRLRATKCKKCQSLRLLHIAKWNTPSLQAHHLTFRSEKALLVQMQSSTGQAQNSCFFFFWRFLFVLYHLLVYLWVPNMLLSSYSVSYIHILSVWIQFWNLYNLVCGHGNNWSRVTQDCSICALLSWLQSTVGSL